MPAAPLLAMAIFFIFCKVCNNCLNKLFDKCFPGWKIGDLDINEVIDGYWESLDEHDLNWSMKEEEQFRGMFKKKYGGVEYSMMDDYSYQRM
jgi:hypothetical protein